MLRSHRIGNLRVALAAGTVTALALLAMAPAFACTPRSTAEIRPARGEAGTVADVYGSLYDPQMGNVVVKWAGTSGVLLNSTAVNADGTFGPLPITIPADAAPGRVSYVSVYQPNDPAGKVSNVLFEVAGTPVVETPPAQAAPVSAPATAPAEAAAPTPAPTAQTAPAPSTQQATAPAATAAARVRPTSGVVAAPPPPPPAAAPIQAPVASAGPPSPKLDMPDILYTGPPGAGAFPAARQPVAVAPSAAIDDGPSLWVLVPLIGMGLTLFAASAAIVVHEVRRRRQPIQT